MPKYHYATVLEALGRLKKKGYTEDFNLREDDIAAHPHNYRINKIFRYEGDTDPDEEAFVFGMKNSNGEKGVFVMGAAATSEGNVGNFLMDLVIKGKISEEE